MAAFAQDKLKETKAACTKRACKAEVRNRRYGRALGTLGAVEVAAVGADWDELMLPS